MPGRAHQINRADDDSASLKYHFPLGTSRTLFEASSWLEYFQASACIAGTLALKPVVWTSHIVPLSSNPLIYRVELLFAGLEIMSGSLLDFSSPVHIFIFIGLLLSVFIRSILEV